MTNHTPSQNASWPTTRQSLTSVDAPTVESTTTAVVVSIELRPVSESRFVNVNERASRNAKRIERQAALAQARTWLSEKAYGDQPESLKKLRLEKGMSQQQLATAAKSTQAQIARIESGARDVQISTVEKLAEALQVDPVRVFNAVRVSKIAALA
jgi:ribosome-binding protein aMBF1 (putative translation factor)